MSTISRNSELEVSSATPPFITTDLDLAAYLKTIGRRLIGTQPQGRFVAFHFEPSATADAQIRRRRVEASSIPMKSHTPECAKIEQFAATLVPVKSNVVCFQDFDTKNYMLELQGRFITITKEQFDDRRHGDMLLQVACREPILHGTGS
jgi:hypothetical protein